MRINKLNQLIEQGEVVKGDWFLDDDHRVTYRERGERESEARVRGTLIAAEPGKLVLAVEQKKSGHSVTASLFKLTGTWQADSKNRITFTAGRGLGKSNVLTFEGSWKLNDSQEIVYAYEQRRLKTKVRHAQELVFKGRWDLSGERQLTYYVGGDTNNALRFRGTFQTQSLLAKAGQIRYQLGAEARRTVKTRSLTLFGTWKFSRGLELFFEIETAQGRKHAIVFGGTLHFKNDTTLQVRLTTPSGEPLGVEILFTKDFFKNNARLFVRLQKVLEETSAEAGVTLSW